MPSIIVLSCVLAWTYCLGASQAFGQSRSGSEIELEIRADDQPAQACLTSEALRSRITHYSARSSTPRGVRLVLYITGPDAAELQIMRGNELVSRRSFEQLPTPCADRRDAVALSIALALERTAATESERAAATSSVARVQTPAATSNTPSSSVSKATTQTADAPSQTAAIQPVAQPEPAAAPVVPVTQPAVSSQPESEPAGPIVLGTMPSSTSHAQRRDGTSPLQFHLGGRFTLEAVPVPVWVGSLGIEMPLAQRVTLDISALASTVGESALAGAHARASFVGLEVVGCGGTPLGAFMLQICAGAGVGLCTVSGRDYPRERPEATLLWAAGLARVMLRWPRADSFAVRLLVQPHVSVSRPELRVEGSPARLRTAWIGGSAGLELWLALP